MSYRPVRSQHTPPAAVTRIPVGIYHTEDPTNVIKAALRRGYEFIWASELLAALQGRGTLPPQPAMLTYDDGRAALYTTAHPVIVSYGVKATVFVTSDFVEGLEVDGTLQPYAPGATWAQLREMHATGLYEWGNHTKTHKGLGNQSQAERLSDLAASNAKIAQELHVPRPQTIAYPNGIIEADTLQDLRASGFGLGFTYSAADQQAKSHRPSPATVNPFAFPRTTRTDASWLDWSYHQVLIDWMFDSPGERNASNQLGFWTVPASGSFVRNGGELVLAGNGTAEDFETADYHPVKPGEWVFSRFVSRSDGQTAGRAEIVLDEYDVDKGLIRTIPLKRYDDAESWTRNERDVQMSASAAFVKYRLAVDAAYDGTLSSLYTAVWRE